MKNIIKLGFIYTLISYCLSFAVFASDSNFTDCKYIASQSFSQKDGNNQFMIIDQVWGSDNYKYSNFPRETRLAIIDTGSLNTAILNLKKYCCENNKGDLSMNSETCKNDKKFFNNNALDSPYLFDHLFDVEMRRLYGATGKNDIYTKTNMQIDTAGEFNGSGRRSRVDKRLTDSSGSNAQEIINKYKEYWKQTPEYNIADNVQEAFSKPNDDFLIYINGDGGSNENEKSESNKVYKALQDYEKRTLYDKYNNACAISEYLYILLSQSVPTDSITDKNTIINLLSKNSCKPLSDSFVAAETNYTTNVIKQSSDTFMNNYIDSYTQYLNQRTETLKSTRRKSGERFSEVVKAVPKLVKKCRA